MIKGIILSAVFAFVESQAVDSPGGCLVCGAGKVITNPNGVVEIPGGRKIRCRDLQKSGLEGMLSLDQCVSLVVLIAECHCSPGDFLTSSHRILEEEQVSIFPSESPSSKPSSSMQPSVAPSSQPSSAPSSVPSSAPSFAPSETPSQAPTCGKGGEGGKGGKGSKYYYYNSNDRMLGGKGKGKGTKAPNTYCSEPPTPVPVPTPTCKGKGKGRMGMYGCTDDNVYQMRGQEGPSGKSMMSVVNVKSLDVRTRAGKYDFVIALPSDPVWKNVLLRSMGDGLMGDGKVKGSPMSTKQSRMMGGGQKKMLRRH